MQFDRSRSSPPLSRPCRRHRPTDRVSELSARELDSKGSERIRCPLLSTQGSNGPQRSSSDARLILMSPQARWAKPTRCRVTTIHLKTCRLERSQWTCFGSGEGAMRGRTAIASKGSVAATDSNRDTFGVSDTRGFTAWVDDLCNSGPLHPFFERGSGPSAQPTGPSLERGNPPLSRRQRGGGISRGP